MDNLLSGIYDTQTVSAVSMAQFGIATVVSLVLGLIIARTYMQGTRYTKSFVITLTLLPAIICVIIMMVNGSIGTGIAVAGAFSLVRFRSVPGTAKEICTLFFAMASGLIAGTGYLGIAGAFTAAMCLAFLLLGRIDFGYRRNSDKYKTFRVVVPEDLDYTGIFDDVFDRYCSQVSREKVRTVNLGSMYELDYTILMKDAAKEKEMIDEIRIRNGNLSVVCGKSVREQPELL